MARRRSSVTSDERGAATVLVVAMMAMLLLVGAGLAVVAAMFTAHRQAQGAADLAALAGAVELSRGGAGCAAARRIAEANGATMIECAEIGSDVRLTVHVSGPRWLGRTGDLVAEARAGPAR